MEDSKPSDTAAPHLITTDSLQWFSVSTPKFILMAVCTLGIYEIYWFYKNWMHVKKLENTQIWPFWRAIFGRFTAFFLFKRVRASAQEHASSKAVPAAALAVLYLLLTGLWRLPDPYWLVAFMTFAPLLVANEAMTEINKRTVDDFQQNGRIEGWNWVAVILGGLTVAVTIYGAFLPTEV